MEQFQTLSLWNIDEVSGYVGLYIISNGQNLFEKFPPSL